MKKTIPLFIGLIVSLVWFGEFFITGPFYEYTKNFFANGSRVMAVMGILVGAYSVFNVNYNRIKYNRNRWFSVIQVTMILLMIFLFYVGGSKSGTPFNAMFLYGFVPLSSTVFSLLAFYIASAAFRAFRAKNIESTLLLVAATIVMFGKIPLGESISEYIPKAAEWIMDGPTSAGRRAINFGAYLGALTMMIRIFFGLERSHISDK